MAYVRQVEESEATGRLEAIYAAGRARAGGVANIIKVISLDAAVTDASMQMYVRLMKRANALSAPRREMLATVVSNINDCYY
jgi:alkylhydroperoxidase family enzyme